MNDIERGISSTFLYLLNSSKVAKGALEKLEFSPAEWEPQQESTSVITDNN